MNVFFPMGILMTVSSLLFMMTKINKGQFAKEEAGIRISGTSLKNCTGFTLIELMVVILMFGILAAVAYPSMNEWRQMNKINSSAMDIKTICEMAKSFAIKNQRNVAVTFTAGTGRAGTYMVYIDDGTTPEVFDPGEQIYKAGQVKENVTLLAGSFAGTQPSTTVFNPFGLATRFGGNVQLRNDTGDIFKRIRVTNGGIIRIESSTTGSVNTWVE